MATAMHNATAAEKRAKLWRYVRLYGLRRALLKVAGRTEAAWLRWLIIGRRKHNVSISVIGCGQFAFSTICWFLQRSNAPGFLDAYDIDGNNAKRLASFFSFRSANNTAESLLANPAVRTVYIASNHASHTPHAIDALTRGLSVYVEKPASISWHQYHALHRAATESAGRLFIGYNRPFSKAIEELVGLIKNSKQPFTMSCYVHGHVLGGDHWYRKPEEGSRICGNAGHWLDLAVHLLTAVHGKKPTRFTACYAAADASAPDDNFSLSLTTDTGDLISLLMSSRSEPFEGVYEQIEAQCGNVSASINDFRSMQVRQGSRHWKRQYSPKDVGHKLAVLQPFLPADQQRDITEVFASTALMLHIADMAQSGSSTMLVDLGPQTMPHTSAS